MEWHRASYVLGPDTNTMKTPSHFCGVLFKFEKVAFRAFLSGFLFLVNFTKFWSQFQLLSRPNGAVQNRQEVGEASALLPYHNFSKNSSFVWILITCTQ